MVNRSKQKGTTAETALVRYLIERTGLPIERRALAGNADKGDIAGFPGLTIEVKNCQRVELAKWIDEAEVERRNARTPFGVVIHKRRGKGNPGQWFATMTVAQLLALLDAAKIESCETVCLEQCQGPCNA